MHSVRIQKVISLIISFFHLIGFWHKGDKATVKQLRLKFFYCIYYPLFPISLLVGAFKNENMDRSVFTAEVGLGVVIVTVKLWFLIWKQHQILDLLNRVVVFSIRSEVDYKHFNDKLRGFMKFVMVFVVVVTSIASVGSVVLILVGSDQTFVVEIAFPFDYKNNEIAYWAAAAFFTSEVTFMIFPHFFSVIIWYLLLICSLRYEVLGNELKNMGGTKNVAKSDLNYNRSLTESRKQKAKENQMAHEFSKDLKTSVETHVHLTELVSELESFFSDLFFMQFATSGLCICGSIYCLAYDMGGNVFEYCLYILMIFYFISELFMITYIGNEIMLSGDRLSYSLFESDWYNQPQSIKMRIIIFGEYLKQPQEIVIGKLYPLILETFTRIMNSAYSMFNILKSFQQ